jgi:hypothetical protein
MIYQSIKKYPMKSTFYSLVFYFLVFSFCNSYGQNADDIKKNLQTNYVTFLKEEGFSPTIDNDGDVKFKYEGNTFYLFPGTDKLYFKLGRYLTDDHKEKFVDLLKVGNSIMMEYRNIRITVAQHDDNCSVLFKSENYLINPNDFKIFFYKGIELINTTIDDFKKRYNQ